MKNYIFLLVLLLFLSVKFAYSQDDLIDENVDDYTVFEKSNFGPNAKHFTYQYFGVDFYLPSVYEEQKSIFYGQSYKFTYGIKYKFQPVRWLSIGTDLNFNVINYNVKDIILLSAILNSSRTMQEKFVLLNSGSEFFMRFFVGKRGNTMGKYFDIAGFGFFTIQNRVVEKYQMEATSMKEQKIVSKQTELFNNLNYGIMLRGGVKYFAITFKYRLTDLLSSDIYKSYVQTDLPKFTFGIEFAIVD